MLEYSAPLVTGGYSQQTEVSLRNHSRASLPINHPQGKHFCHPLDVGCLKGREARQLGHGSQLVEPKLQLWVELQQKCGQNGQPWELFEKLWGRNHIVEKIGNPPQNMQGSCLGEQASRQCIANERGEGLRER